MLARTALFRFRGGSRSSAKKSPAASSRLSVLFQRRFKTTQHSFSSYEFPLHKEAPVVTRTTAKQVKVSSSFESSSKPDEEFVRLSEDPVDHFDDAHSLSPVERQSQLQAQKQFLSTNLAHHWTITTETPDFIPPNLVEQLEIPKTQLTTLQNGIRVVSQETYGQVCTVGLLSDVGSRHEKLTGTCHLLELLAFQSTTSQTGMEILQQLQAWGATSFCNTNREQTLYCLDVLRPNVHEGMALLKDVTLHPLLHPAEVEDCKLAMGYQAMDFPPEVLVGEVLQVAAYGSDQQLGRPHFCPQEEITHLSSQSIQEFHQHHMTQNPQGLVVAGAGIDHAELVDMASHHFGHLQQDTSHHTETIPSTYRGGAHQLVRSNSVDGFTRLSVAVGVGGWHSDDLVATCVLQTLLGGGNSFSAGGPGKGMYSRLYRQVLNRYFWAESAEAFTAFHNEGGLFGMGGSSKPEKTRDLSRVLCEHLANLSVNLVSDEEFDRARNMLKCNVLTQLESRLVLFEDMGRQVLTYGHREDTETMCRKIDAVTKEDLRELVRQALKQPLTVAAVGDDLSNVPSHEEVTSWIK